MKTEPSGQSMMELAEQIDREVGADDCTINLVRRTGVPRWTNHEYDLARALLAVRSSEADQRFKVTPGTFIQIATKDPAAVGVPVYWAEWPSPSDTEGSR